MECKLNMGSNSGKKINLESGPRLIGRKGIYKEFQFSLKKGIFMLKWQINMNTESWFYFDVIFIWNKCFYRKHKNCWYFSEYLKLVETSVNFLSWVFCK